jgi:hypothetical protein
VLSSALLVLLAGCNPTVPASSAPHGRDATTVELARGRDSRAPSFEETAPRAARPPAPAPALDFAPWPGTSPAGAPRLVYVRAAWSTAALDVERRGLFDSATVRRLAQPFRAVVLDVSDADARALEQTLLELGVRDVPSVVLEGCRGERRLVRVLDEPTLTAALEGCLSGDEGAAPP